MKKALLTVFMALTLMLALAATPALAAAGTVTLTVSSDKTNVHPGDQVTVTVAISNPSQLAIAGISFRINLTDGLEYVSHTDYAGSWFGLHNYNTKTGKYDAVGTSEKAGMTEAQWTVLTAVYKVKDEAALGEQSITVTGLDPVNGDTYETLPNAITNNAGLKVSHTEHTWDAGQQTKPAGCTTPGEMTYTCTTPGCGATTTEEITALGHQWNAGEETKAPTCTEAGVKTYTCQRDSAHTYTEPITALGHSKPEDDSLIETVKEASCTEAGQIKYICERCEEAVTEEVAALGHEWDEGSVTKEPAEGVAGEKTYTCTRCGETKTEPIPALTPSPASPPVPVKPTAAASVPATGDGTPLALYAGLLALCLAGLVLVRRGRRE